MERAQWQKRVVVDADIHHGEPCIKGTRILVTIIIGSIADGMTPQEIFAAYPQLTDEDIRAKEGFASVFIPPICPFKVTKIQVYIAPGPGGSPSTKMFTVQITLRGSVSVSRRARAAVRSFPGLSPESAMASIP